MTPDQLLDEVKSGSEEAGNELILLLKPIAVHAAKKVARAYNKQPDELIAFSLYRLVWKVRNINNEVATFEELKSYVYKCLHLDVRTHMFRDKVVKIPKSAKIPVSISHCIDTPNKHDYNPAKERLELIEKCISTPMERAVIELRKESLTNIEISEILCCSRQHVAKLLKSVERRYLERLDDEKIND